MRLVTIVSVGLCAALLGWAQTDRGSITGTVQDQATAMVPGAKVSVRNTDTGATSETVTTDTGNFTLAQLPAGPYQITVEAPGFKKYIGQGTQVPVAQTVRLDVLLEVGSTTESVTVEATAPLLRTENAEQSVNVNGDRINSLPLNFGGGAGAIGAIRNQMAFIVLSPGVSGSGTGARVNGFPGNTFRVMIEGQDSTSGNTQARVDETQASVEAIEEFSMQTSNFSAEYGQAMGGIFNFSIRSGTNQFHGSGYEYFVNEALAAARPYTGLRPTSRKHNFGGTIGGPVILPKLYNGRDKTFFFFNWEVFRNVVRGTGAFATVPTEAYRRGDFSAALTNRATLVNDGLGRAIPENGIYDPLTSRTVDGRVYRDLFTNNVIPTNRIDPVAAKIQGLIPAPVNGNLVQNWLQNEPYVKLQSIPSFKIDHSFDPSNKVSFYYSRQRTDLKSGFDSLPIPITATRFQNIYSDTARLNYDRTITPTLLLHLGSGFIRYLNPDSAAPDVLNFDAAGQLGFTGSATGRGFPRITNLSNGNFGGMGLNMGPANANRYFNDKWTSVASATYIRGNHTYKLGGEMRIDIFTDRNERGAQGVLDFNRSQTGLPAAEGQNLPYGVGLSYASFLLGATNTATVNAVQDPQWRKTSWALYVQDSWKATRKLTLDYGLRWDLLDAGHEIWNRSSTFSPGVANPSAGGALGGMIYEGDGPGRCNCSFTEKYPFALGPRLGVAYQITPGTVLRGGWGLSYGNVQGFGYITNQTWYGVGFDARVWESPGIGEAATLLRNGLQYNVADLYRPTLSPGVIPTPGALTPAPPVIIDRNWARPPRVNQWSISLQRELIKNLAVEVAYVGNRGVWVNSGGNSALTYYNAVSQERLRSFGIDINRAEDRTLLTSQIGSAAAQARGLRVPYAGYPSNATVIQALRPFPQFNSILAPRAAPLGNTWYDSLQVKVTKRYSHGLDFTLSYTWSKELERISGYNDVFNRDNQKRLAGGAQPQVLVLGFNYETPKWNQGRAISFLTGGWTIGGLLRYSSGVVLGVPNSTNGLNNQLGLPNATPQNRVEGQSLYTKDLNCHCIDPTQELALNPAAWTNPAPGQWGTSAAAYNNFRAQRFPDEQLSIGRRFRIREGMWFQVRAEFFNVFNRMALPNPVTTNPQAITTRDNQGRITGGFGYIDWQNPNQPRNGQLVARFEF